MFSFATIHLHALSAAIPHSILILHSLLDILPFPQRCVSYELKSGSVKCFDEKKSLGGVVVKQKNKQVDSGEQGWEWEPVLFDDDEEEDGDEGGKGKGKGKEMTDGTTWQEKGDVRVRIVVSSIPSSHDAAVFLHALRADRRDIPYSPPWRSSFESG